MSRSMNTICLSGYLGRKPELGTLPSGDAATTLRLAVTNAKYDSETDEWLDDTVWMDVKVYGKRAETMAQYLDSGSFVLIEGQLLHPRIWTDNEGGHHAELQVRAKEVIFGPRTDAGESSGTGFAPSPADPDGDIPF